MRRHAQWIFASTLLGVDVVMTGLAFLLAYLLRPRDATPNQVIPPFAYYVGMMVLSVLALVVVFFFYKLYHLRRGMSRLDELYSILPAISISVIVGVAFTAFVYRSELDYPRVMIAYFWMFSLVLIGMGRLVHGTIRAGLYARGWGESRTLIVGAGIVRLDFSTMHTWAKPCKVCRCWASWKIWAILCGNSASTKSLSLCPRRRTRIYCR